MGREAERIDLVAIHLVSTYSKMAGILGVLAVHSGQVHDSREAKCTEHGHRNSLERLRSDHTP